MDLSLATFEPLLKSLTLAGLPYLGTALGAMLTPVAGPFGMLVAPAINLMVPAIAAALGQPATATPQQLADTIAADPDTAKAKLADLEEQHQFALASDKQTQDFQIATQAQQVAVNTTEATNPSMFVAGWRPAMGWGLGGIVLTSFVLPYPVWLLAACGLHLPPPPMLDPQAMYVLAGLLGITVAARSADKVAGTAAPAIGGTSKVVTTTKRAAR